MKKDAAQAQPTLRPYVSIANKNVDQRMTLAIKYMDAQKKSRAGAALAPHAARLRSAFDWVDMSLFRADLPNPGGYDAEADTLAAERELDDALLAYASSAARVAAGNAAVLASLGVWPENALPTCSDVLVQPGEAPGQAVVTFTCPYPTAFFVVEYRPEAAGALDDWTPLDVLPSEDGRAVIDGLAPGQAIRARVRAVGNASGPWSDEAVGAAREAAAGST
jgi:hypothetical protein